MDIRELGKELYDLDFVDVARVDPAAAAILYEATRAVGIVLEEREKLDAAGKHYTPVHLVMGEDHADAAQILTEVMITEGLRKKEASLKVGMERREQAILVNIASQLNIKSEDIPTLKRSLDKHNSDGSIGLLQLLVSSASPYAPYSNAVMNRLLLDAEISTKFSDATLALTRAPEGGILETPFIDAKDPKVIDALDSLNITAFQNVNAIDRVGIFVRNEYAAREISEFGKNARVTVSFAGGGHVMGIKAIPERNGQKAQKEAPFGQSLPVRLKAREDVVIAMTPSTGAHKGIMPKRNSDFEVRVETMHGLPDAEFHWKKRDYFNSDESSWVNARLQNLKMNHLIIPGGEEFFRPYVMAFQQKVFDVIQDAGIIPEAPSAD